MTLWDLTKPLFKVDKPIRLIELFCGYGSQFMAMKRIGANVESWLAVDFDKYAIQAYNTIHNTDYQPTDICNIGGGTT
jgi:DNA (cytosine-5)-methyltransferase 1